MYTEIHIDTTHRHYIYTVQIPSFIHYIYMLHVNTSVTHYTYTLQDVHTS